MNKKIVFIIFVSLIIIILLPLTIDWLVIGNNFPSNISNSDWVGFLGGYIGAIIGSVVSLFGIMMTIRFAKEQIQQTQEQYEEQKRLNHIPILDLKIIDTDSKEDAETINLFASRKESVEEKYKKAVISFDIANVGLGAAINIKYSMECGGQEQVGAWGLWCKGTIRSGSNDMQKISFHYYNNRFSPNLLIYYDDVLGNCYLKKIKLAFDTYSDATIVYIISQNNGELSERPYEKYYVIKMEDNENESDEVTT